MAAKRSKSAGHPAQDMNIQALPDELLRRIFLLIPQGRRLETMNATCCRFRHIMAQPDMWLSLTVGSRLYDYEHESISVKCVKLLQQRSSATQQLTIEPFSHMMSGSSQPDDLVQRLLLAVAPAPQLRQLVIAMPYRGTMSIGGATLVHVQLFSGLTSLSCHGIRPGRSLGSELDMLFSELPSLRSLRLKVDRESALCRSCSIPTPLLTCTQLTELEVSVDLGWQVLDWGALPPTVSRLQQLRTLRLRNCLTAPLTEHVSALGRLTHLGLCCNLRRPDDAERLLVQQPLPASAPVLVALRSLDCTLQTHPLPASLLGLAGLEDLTLRSLAAQKRTLVPLSRLQRLSRLRLVACDFDNDCRSQLEGVEGCAALRDLSIVACKISWCLDDIIPPVTAFSRLTHLSVARNEVFFDDLQHMWPAMPQLRACDISHTDCARCIEPQAMVALLQRVPRLRDVYFEAEYGDHDAEVLDAVLQVQRAVPRVVWHAKGAPSHTFG